MATTAEPLWHELLARAHHAGLDAFLKTATTSPCGFAYIRIKARRPHECITD